MKFVSVINSDGSTFRYSLEDTDGRRRVSARSLLGAIYASAEFGDEIYLVNETEDGQFPQGIDIFRA